jgi:N-sulfoglucosamine sulfohydrolase
VPPFLPDTPEIRSDLLDYCFEIEHFDRHLGRILDLLEERGELDNTIVVVTADNGMAFPRAKANVFEYGAHLPMAISWPKRIPAGQVVERLTSLVDLAPTFLEVAGVAGPTEHPMQGLSLLPMLLRGEPVAPASGRGFALVGRERHSSSRYGNLGYPQRALRTEDFLLIRNFKPERWPAGTPRKFETDSQLGPMHGGYHDIDACPSLDFLIANRDDPNLASFFHMSVDKRPPLELYAIGSDPGCLQNLADKPEFPSVRDRLSAKLESELRETRDSRLGPDPDIWETYRRYSRIRKFPKPDEEK